MRSRLLPGTTSNVAKAAPPPRQSGCLAPGRPHSQRQSTPAKGCLAPTRAIGKADVGSTRPLPDALPAGAPPQSANRVDHLTPKAPFPRRAPRGCPLRQCWDPTNRLTPLALLPTLSKTAHPHEALSSVCHSLRSGDTRGYARHARTTRCRRPATRIDFLTPEAACAARSTCRGPSAPMHPVSSWCPGALVVFPGGGIWHLASGIRHLESA
jgi:hypothetical protein